MTLPQDDQDLIIPWDDSGNGLDFQLPQTAEWGDDMPMITFDDLPGEAVGIDLNAGISFDPTPAPSQWVPQVMYTDPMLPQNQDLINPAVQPQAAFSGETLNIDPFENTPTQPEVQPAENIVFQDPIAVPQEPVAPAPELNFSGETLNIDPFETPLQTPPVPEPQPATPAPAPTQAPQPQPTPAPTPAPTLSPNIPPMTATTQEPQVQTANPPVEDTDDDISLSFLDEEIEVPAPVEAAAPTPAATPEPAPTPAPHKSLDRTSILDQTIARMTERKDEINTIKTGKQDEVATLEEEIKKLKEQVALLKWEISELEEEDKNMEEDIKAIEQMKSVMSKGKTTEALKKSVEEKKTTK